MLGVQKLAGDCSPPRPRPGPDRLPSLSRHRVENFKMQLRLAPRCLWYLVQLLFTFVQHPFWELTRGWRQHWGWSRVFWPNWRNPYIESSSECEHYIDTLACLCATYQYKVCILVLIVLGIKTCWTRVRGQRRTARASDINNYTLLWRVLFYPAVTSCTQL